MFIKEYSGQEISSIFRLYSFPISYNSIYGKEIPELESMLVFGSDVGEYTMSKTLKKMEYLTSLNYRGKNINKEHAINQPISIQKDKNSNLTNIVIDTSIDFDKLSKAIENRFLLSPIGDFLTDITGDTLFKYYQNKDHKISMGFGKWYPFVIFSETEKSNELVETIYKWLQSIENLTEQYGI